MKHSSEYRDPVIAGKLVAEITELVADYAGIMTLMEVCGTHTMAIHQHGIRTLMPPQIRLISGPGCPVCVTPIDYVDHAIALARRPQTIIATFGDMMRVPGSSSNLLREKAQGGDVRIVYSPLDAVALAEKNPQVAIVFLGIGFETTAPTIAGSILEAQRRGLNNFFVLGAHKTMPTPMQVLAADPELQVSGFLAPAHVSAVIGADAYQPLVANCRIPCVVTGFEPLDVLLGIKMLGRQILACRAEVEIEYRRLVRQKGNRKAQQLLERVFTTGDARWRGIGIIPDSGLDFRPEFAAFDAAVQLPVTVEESIEPAGCRCGDILKGKITPPECPLFARRCTPQDPVGACMVSSEGTCAAAYKYGDHD
ncbi:MAG: hydrogenase formation protein HypD [Desulfuromonadales bacterium]|nr:hydrogenase formation protein HypD [Desulfuromonadales bacterium]